MTSETDESTNQNSGRSLLIINKLYEKLSVKNVNAPPINSFRPKQHSHYISYIFQTKVHSIHCICIQYHYQFDWSIQTPNK